MLNVLQYSSFTSFDYATEMCNGGDAIINNKVYNWLLYGKLPEDVTINPTYDTQYQVPSARNRYIASVTVNPIPEKDISVSLAVGATLVVSNKLMSTVTSTDNAIATAQIIDDQLTITGVAAGTATITVKDEAADVIYVITVTVA